MSVEDKPLHPVRGYLRSKPSRGRTTEAVTDALREAILDGALAPSTWLREDEIAATLDVSRTPVREALRRLADEGLAHKTAHHGTVVSPMSMEDILALYVIRENLEGLAARLAATRGEPGLVPALRKVQARMEALADTGDAAALSRHNITFHRLIREAAGNLYLERFLGQAEQAVRRLAPTTFAFPGRAVTGCAEHAEIIEAIAAGDPDAAEEAGKRHMRNAREIRFSKMMGA
ncbi:DNA-binding GntR family transcriptional regulator [Spinactinospora alkalitolerans]|uniref:DNA-binding GntR family transcriptional regulator n=1 Tax=Spinactinospora alkalitolerans TaxID=687207 RepID=A0A852U292_9ACTN|nr:GntR family transcriptional regulator [Spinactinospora alkalitolerans]NYE50231.1 DNA-binding GntR family transcriptional regulator [Spinactinospora alkalitolerans]